MRNSAIHYLQALLCLAAVSSGATPMAQSGAVDTNFTATVSGSYVHSVALAGDGKVVLGGNFNSVNRTPRSHIARLNADGTLDVDFNPGTGANAEVLAVAAQTDGKVLLAGAFTSVNRLPCNRIARLNSDGSVDPDFDPGTGADQAIRAIRAQADGKILIGGQFTRYNGTPRSCVARLNPDGSLDASFDPGRGVGGTLFVNTLAILSDGKIMVAGDFSSFDAHPCGSIVRLHADGSLDEAFDSGIGTTPDNPIISLAIQPDGKIVIGGSFYKYQGVPRVNIARLHPDGSLDSSFDPGKGISGGLYNMIQTVAVWDDGRILVGGSFAKVNAAARANLVALNSDGTMDTNSLAVVDSPVRSMVIGKDHSVVLGGEFSRVGGTSHSRVARLGGTSSTSTATLLNWTLGSGGFHCQVNAACPAVVLEASSDLVQWLPLSTNATVNGAAELRDSTTLACRFYRVRQL